MAEVSWGRNGRTRDAKSRQESHRTLRSMFGHHHGTRFLKVDETNVHESSDARHCSVGSRKHGILSIDEWLHGDINVTFRVSRNIWKTRTAMFRITCTSIPFCT